MANFGGGGHYGACALTGLVAVYTTFHAPCYGATKQSSPYLVYAYSSAKHLHKHIGNNTVINNQYHQRQQYVYNRHYRRNYLSYIGYAFHPSDYHKGYKCGNQKSYDPHLHAKGA